MTLLVIAGIIFLGLILIILEVFVVPGTTIVGIMGILLIGTGIYFTYAEHGNKTGTYTLISMLLLTCLLVLIGFKMGAWKAFMLKDIVEGKVKAVTEKGIGIGDTGIVLTDLRPVGKALINNKKFEVQTQIGYIEKDKKIKVIKTENNNIIVKLKT